MMAHTPAGEAFTQLVLTVFKLNGLLLEVGEALAAPNGQSSSRWQVMGCVDERPCSVSEIARRMGLTRQSVQRTADLLVQDGLAVYQPNPDHKRAQLLGLTPQGLNILRAIEGRQYLWANELGQELNQAELQVGVALLNKVIEKVSK